MLYVTVCITTGRYAGSWTNYLCIPITDAYISESSGLVLWKLVLKFVISHLVLCLCFVYVFVVAVSMM